MLDYNLIDKNSYILSSFNVGDYVISHSKIIYYIESDIIRGTVKVGYKIVNIDNGEIRNLFFANNDQPAFNLLPEQFKKELGL